MASPNIFQYFLPSLLRERDKKGTLHLDKMQMKQRTYWNSLLRKNLPSGIRITNSNICTKFCHKRYNLSVQYFPSIFN